MKLWKLKVGIWVSNLHFYTVRGRQRNQPQIRGGWRNFAFAADGGISHRSAAAGVILRSRRTAESATDPRRLAELCVRGGRWNQPQIRGGWRNCAFAADGGISHRFAAAGGNHLCARDASAIPMFPVDGCNVWDTKVGMFCMYHNLDIWETVATNLVRCDASQTNFRHVRLWHSIFSTIAVVPCEQGFKVEEERNHVCTIMYV